MRIIQIGGTYVSAQKQIQFIIHNSLIYNGHESYILYIHGDSDDPAIIRYENKIMGLIRRGLIKIFGKNPVFAGISTINAIRKIKKINPDIVHMHVIHHGYLNYPMFFRFLSKRKIPVVFTMHDMWAFTGGCYHYFDIECNGYQLGCHKCRKSMTHLDCKPKHTSKYFNIKKQLFKTLSDVRFVSVSAWVYSEIQKSHLSEYPQYLIWNAVESFEINKSNRYSSTNKFRIIGVAAVWSEGKGISRFFKLANELGNNFEIILVGRASKKYYECAPDNVQFVGLISDKQRLAELYSSCDLHVSMSLEETFGMTFVEAALAGIRSLGFDATAIPTVIEKTKGYIVPKLDIKAAADTIRHLNDNRQLCRLTLDELNEIKSTFSSSKMSELYIDIYHDIINAKDRRL